MYKTFSRYFKLKFHLAFNLPDQPINQQLITIKIVQIIVFIKTLNLTLSCFDLKKNEKIFFFAC